MCDYFLIPKKDEFEKKILVKFNKYFFIEDLPDDERIKQLSECISKKTYILVHFGGMSETSLFCDKIRKWKNLINNKNIEAILPISTVPNDDDAYTLYNKLKKDDFVELEYLDLDNYKKKWEEKSKVMLKEEIIFELFLLCLMIERATIVKEENKKKFEVLKEDLKQELNDIKIKIENEVRFSTLDLKALNELTHENNELKDDIFTEESLSRLCTNLKGLRENIEKL
jgi:hypothetical protein